MVNPTFIFTPHALPPSPKSSLPDPELSLLSFSLSIFSDYPEPELKMWDENDVLVYPERNRPPRVTNTVKRPPAPQSQPIIRRTVSDSPPQTQPERMLEGCQQIIAKLCNHTLSARFRNLRESAIATRPNFSGEDRMDLNTVRAKLDRGAYEGEVAFFHDIELIVSCSLAANPHCPEAIEAVHEFEKLFLSTQRKHSRCKSKPQCKKALALARRHERKAGIVEKARVNVRRARRAEQEKELQVKEQPQVMMLPETASHSYCPAFPVGVSCLPEGKPRRQIKPNPRYMD